MANPLVLQFIVDDKGNVVLKGIQQNIRKMDKVTKGLGKTLTHVFGSAVMLQGLMLFKQGIAGAVKEVFEFNKVFKQTEGITGTTGKALDILKKKTIDVSNTTEHTATALAKVTLQVAKMGFTVEEALEVIPHVANLATAAIGDINEVTQLAVQTMKSFQMEASDMEHIVNVVQGTVSKTAIDIKDFAEAMKFVAPIGKTMTVALEETAAMIGVLGDVGIRGSLGGTTLKNMFLNIMRPSENVRKILEKMNWQGKNFTDVLKHLHEGGISVGDMLETFNRRAVAGSLALSQLHEKVDILREALEKDKIVTAEVAEVIRRAWIPQLQLLKNVFVNTFVVMGNIIDDSDVGINIKSITDRIKELQYWLVENPEVVIKFAKDIAAVAEAAAKFAAIGFETVIKHIKGIVRIFKILIGLQLATVMWGWAKAAKKASIGFKTAAFSMKTFGSAIPVIGQATIVILALGEAFKFMADRAIDAEKAAIRASWGTNVAQIIKQIEVAKEFLKSLEDIEKYYARKGGVPKGAVGLKRLESGQTIAIKLYKDLKTHIEKEAEVFAEAYGMKVDFFKRAHQSGEVFLKMLEKKLGVSEEAAKKTKEILDNLFKIPRKDETGAKAGAEAGAEAGKDYMEAMFRVMEEMSGSLAAGIPIEKIRKIFADQMQGLAEGIGTPEAPAEIMTKFAFDVLPRVKTPRLGQFAAETDFQLNVATVAYQKHHKEIAASFGDAIDKNKKSLQAWVAFSEEINEFQTIYAEEQNALRIAYAWEQFDAYAEAATMAIDIVQMLQDAAFEKLKNRHKEQLKMFDESAAKELKNAEGNAFKIRIIEAKLATERRNLIKKQEKEERKAATERKRWAIIESIINTALGITKVFATVGPPASFILAAVVAAAGLAQVGIIAAQEEFRKGGFTGYGSPNEVAGSVHRREYVIPDKEVAALGGETGVEEMIDARIAGIGGTGRPVYIMIDTLIGTEEYERGLFTRLQKESQRW